MDKQRRLPRFEVVKHTAGRYCAYDYLTKTARFPVDPRSFEQAQGLVEVMSAQARAQGEELSVVRADTPSAAPKSSNRKPQQH